MGDQHMTAAMPLACEIAAYSDEELDRYLEQNGRVVSVQDPENISSIFIQRLRDICEATKPCAADLDQVTARLQALPPESEPFNRSPSLATTVELPPQEELDQEHLCQERQAYYALIDAGGRPPYPFHLLEDFFWNQEQYLEYKQYRDIISFWREEIPNKAKRTCFCVCHLSRWRCFRRLQRIIRERTVKSEQSLIRAADFDSWEAYVECYNPREGQWGFPEYVKSITTRLAKYSFARPFQPDQDIERQDKLTTWIEYLSYEYWFYDQAASYVERRQQWHDDAWKELLDLNVLRPDETYNVICNIETAYRYANERENAEKVIKAAATALSSTEKAIAKSQAPRKHLQKQLLADQFSLSAAKERHQTVIARNDAVGTFLQKIRQYRQEQSEVDRYSCLLRWIEQQIPSIEHEISSLNNAEDDPGVRDSSESLKRARSREANEAGHNNTEDNKQSTPGGRTVMVSSSPSRESSKRNRASSIDDGRPPKRLKNSSRSVIDDYRATDSSASTTLPLIPDTRTPHGFEGDSLSLQVFKPLRRSTRIAAKKKEPATIADRPTGPLSMEQEQSRTRSATKCAKGSRPRRDSQRPAAKPQGVIKKGRSSARLRAISRGGEHQHKR